MICEQINVNFVLVFLLLSCQFNNINPASGFANLFVLQRPGVHSLCQLHLTVEKHNNDDSNNATEQIKQEAAELEPAINATGNTLKALKQHQRQDTYSVVKAAAKWIAIVGFCLAAAPFISRVNSNHFLGEAKDASLQIPKETGQTPSRIQPTHPLSVAGVVKKLRPSVVRIDTVTQSDNENGLFLDDQSQGHQGQGSGFIYSADGLVLTNSHVVEGAAKVTVSLTDGRAFQARVMGTDELVDIAVLKIETTEPLPMAKLGDSDDLEVGQVVVAMGSPGGLDNTVTMGIVSGLNRNPQVVGVPYKISDYIQTDAAINPGNSGGPLVDVETGDVVGINSFIRAHMEGTSFAIPVSTIRSSLAELAEGRQISHGYIGVKLLTTTRDWAKERNKIERTSPIPEVDGVMVTKVYKDTPAGAADLRAEDVIVNVGGKEVKTVDEVRQLIDRAVIGKDLQIMVHRDRQVVRIVVKPMNIADDLKRFREQQQMEQIK